MEAHSLFELNEYIRRVIALNFREPIWIKAEANQVNKSRNNFYLNLVEKEKGQDNIIAEANGVLWARNYFFLKKKLGDVLDQILVDGTEMLIKVKVDFNERYGLKLQIEDIDPAYTFGQTEIRRQEIIERIKKEGLHELNEQYPLPDVIQRIAVLSSETAAGYQDFKNQLANNTYGYDYKIELFNIPVQGTLLESKFIAALSEINDNQSKFDVIVVVRGGGSKLDLSWFDTYPIASSIAKCKLPLFCGIGHDIDFSLVDMVAHTSVKTPTAVADYLIEHNLNFESRVLGLEQSILAHIQDRVLEAESRLDRLSVAIQSLVIQQFSESDILLSNIYNRIISSTEMILSNEINELNAKELLLQNLEPENVLKRGYAVLYKKDKSIHSEKEIKKGEEFLVELSDGKIHSQRVK
jgi:exodeoxyribonuclease VII large subunit